LIETYTPGISTTKLKIENDQIIQYNDKNDRNTELESSFVYMQAAKPGINLLKTGVKIQQLGNALKRSLADFNQNYFKRCIGIEVTGNIGNYDVKSQVQNKVSSG